jgi:uncharacterized RDD family membrane protein YckC
MLMSRLQGLAKKGQLSRIHDVSDDGQTWRKASSVPEIFERRAESVSASMSEGVSAVRQQRNQANTIQSTGEAQTVGSGQEAVAASSTTPGGESAKWHYSINGVQYGPTSKIEISQLIKSGSLCRDDLVWKEGMATWGEASNVGELAGLFQGVKSKRRRASSSDENLTTPMRRWFARTIDRLVLFLAMGLSLSVVVGVLLMTGAIGEAAGGEDMGDGVAAVLGLGALIALAAACIVPMLIVAIFQIYFLSKHSQSIGKHALKMRIVRIDDDQPAGFANGFVLRSLCNNLIGILLFPVTFGAYFIIDACFIFRDDRRCIHDLIANTKVIDVE